MLNLNKNTKLADPEIMYFDNDDEFYEFCVVPQIVTSEYQRQDGSIGYVADWNFSNAYLDAIDNGIYFIIKDENSNIYKNKEVTYRVNTKPIQNLLPYFNDSKLSNIENSLDEFVNKK